MSVNVSPSDAKGTALLSPRPGGKRGETPFVPAFVRAAGGVRVAFEKGAFGTQPIHRAESGGYRVRFPRAEGCEAVIINTGGGMAGGDRMTAEMSAGPGASAVVTTQAAEKIYRSQGPDASIGVSLDLAAGSRLAWLPQEAILFSGGRMHRRIDVSMAASATLTLADSLVFGRIAMGEILESGSVRDRWRVRRDDKLVFAEDVRLDGPVALALARRVIANGAAALATILHIAPDAETRLDAMRASLAVAACECGASAWNGLLVARFLSVDPQALRADLARCLERFRGMPMPRSWQC